VSKPILLGLILDGGESKRMGTDKGSLVYHKLSPLEQRQRHLKAFESLDILAYVSSGVFKKPSENFNIIPDHKDFTGGPGAGILSAHLFRPEAAWLVIACDFPFADIQAMRDLISQRRGNGFSVAYKHPDSTVEPLFAIWEPETLVHFLGQFKMGDKSPRKALEQTQAITSVPENLRTLVNINSPLEAQAYPELHH
jgi:molybdopterin-guanine dinucleotide biosynthesis protein A